MKAKAIKLFSSLVITLAALVLCVVQPDFKAASVNAAADYGNETMKTYARMVASEVNKERAAAGLSPMKFCDMINEVSILRAKECVTEFSHTRPNGTLCFTALDEADVPYYTAGENIACGQKTPAEVMRAWMNSTEHRDNILSSDFEYIGVGVYYADGLYYWTQLFTGGLPVSGEIVPFISSQPKSIRLPRGATAEFSVKAQGSGLSYQWFFKKKGNDSWNSWNNHTTSTTTALANDSWDGMQVRCRVTDSTGMIMTSDAATVTIVDGPVITQQPRNVTAAPGEVVFFDIAATGRDLAYQWYFKKADASGWSRWNNHTAASTSGTANDSWNGMQVFCRVTDAGGISVDSQAATVTVKQTVIILSHPQNVTTSPGLTATFEVKASGRDLTYQWFYKKSGASSWSLWKKHTGSSISVMANETWDGMKVYCRVTDSSGAFVNSDSATIKLTAQISITRQPENVTTQPGRSVSFTVIAKGNSLRYQWYFKKSGASDWSLWNNHTQSTVTAMANDTWNGIQVKCRITDSFALSVDSQPATVTFAGTVTITSGPANAVIRAGESVRFSASAEGEGLSCQWYYRKKDASTWSVWNGRTTTTTTATSNTSWDGMQVFCLFTDKYGNTASSGCAKIYLLTDE